MIGTYGPGPQPAGRPRDWRFRTPVRRLVGCYFEQWISVDGTNRVYGLDRIAFSLLLLERISEREVVALHSDPNEPDGPHAPFKRGPHLHVTLAEQPLPHAHLGLAMESMPALIDSVDGLTAAVERALFMLSEEVLGLYALL